MSEQNVFHKSIVSYSIGFKAKMKNAGDNCLREFDWHKSFGLITDQIISQTSPLK